MRRPTILLVEDNRDHAELTRRALERADIEYELEVRADGESALRYLFGEEGTGGEGAIVDLVLLDYHLPGLNGGDVLKHIRASSRMRNTPVVVLSTSARPEEMKESYRLGANSYLTKPAEWAVFQAVIRRLAEYWTQRARMPEEAPTRDAPDRP
ncbi:MAG TPA: response regulator [Dehalococcoidia bacterium]|nr:response regulator [Dehalococcoidia bacterium]